MIETMMRPFRKLLAIGLLLLFCVTARGQDYASVSAKLNTTALNPGGQAVIAVVLDVKPGFHAQSHTPRDEFAYKCVLEMEPNPAVDVLEPVFPPGKDETYGQLGTLNVYTGKTIIYVPVTLKASAAPGPTKLKGKISYQICDDKSCFAPQDTPFSIDTKIAPPAEVGSPANQELFANFD